MSPIAPIDSPPRSPRRRSKRSRAPRAGEPFPLRRRARARLPFKRELSRGMTVALVGALTVIGAAIRLAVTRGLSVDEIATVDQAHQPLGRLISRLAHGGVYPPLHPVLEWGITHVIGDGDFAVRLPSLIAGVALIPAVAWLAVEMFDRRTAVVATLFACVAPSLVWYSQEASGYVLVALFGTLALIGAARAARSGRAGDWALHCVAAAAAIWSDWSGVLIVIAAELLLAAGWRDRRQERAAQRRYLAGWTLDTLALACQLVPLALLFASELNSSGGLAGVTNVAASGVSFYSAVSNVAWGLFGFQPAAITGVLSAVWPLAMLASLLMVGRGLERRSALLLACAIIPAVGVLVLGLVAAGSFDIRYFVAAVPPVLVLLARTATAWPGGRVGRLLVAGGILLVLSGALVNEQINTSNPRRYDYAQAFAQVQRDARRSAAVFIEPSNLQAVVARETPGLRASALGPHLPPRRRTANVFVVTSFSHRPALQRLLNRELGALHATRHLVSHHAYPGIGVWWFR